MILDEYQESDFPFKVRLQEFAMQLFLLSMFSFTVFGYGGVLIYLLKIEVELANSLSRLGVNEVIYLILSGLLFSALIILPTMRFIQDSAKWALTLIAGLQRLEDVESPNDFENVLAFWLMPLMAVPIYFGAKRVVNDLTGGHSVFFALFGPETDIYTGVLVILADWASLSGVLMVISGFILAIFETKRWYRTSPVVEWLSSTWLVEWLQSSLLGIWWHYVWNR